MQMLNQKKVINKKVKKSHLLIFGSFLVFSGILVVSWNYLLVIKNSVYSDMMLLISDSIANTEEIIIESIPEVENLTADVPITEENNEVVDNVVQQETSAPAPTPPPINYDKYLGVLEIPRISLKRGFYGTDSQYNNIQYNVTMVNGSTLPDVVNGNLILMAHSGDAYISYFAYLYKLEIGDTFTVTILDRYMTYRVDQIEVVEPNDLNKLEIYPDKDYITLMTCTPYGINTHRLLVRGVRIEDKDKPVYITTEAFRVNVITVTSLVALPIVLLLLIYIMIKPVEKNSKNIINNHIFNA